MAPAKPIWHLRNFAILGIIGMAVLLVVTACSGPVPSEQEQTVDRQEEGSATTLVAQRPGSQRTGQKGAQTAPSPPFAQRIRVPDFPAGVEWLNTAGPLRRQDLQGKFVLLDFWTYCCINCMHVLPELKKLERAYPNELVVIGVHSAKFETEQDSQNIADAILRHEIEHPVVNDADHRIWNTYGITSWPTIVLIDPQGYFVGRRSGEFKAEEIDTVLKAAIPYYRQQGLLDETPIHFQLLAHEQEETPLRYPGKVLADAQQGGRLFISDSNHNRIVITSFDGHLQEVIGSGLVGSEDGDYQQASFNHPQGTALHGQTLYVADTENHLLRKVDLQTKQVTTIAGTGEQARTPWPGLDLNRARRTALSSPWALYVHEDDLYIAMAGPHQIWKMKLDESEIGPYAGNGREDIIDGRLLPRQPYALESNGKKYSSFAQPSGLTSDGTWLYVADSEGSSIRAVPLDGRGLVRTVVGTAHLPVNRLFEFGDRDGAAGRALLQHPLGVAYVDGKIYVADTYNNKIKVVDSESGHTRTLVGTGEPGYNDQQGLFDEPAGLSHAAGFLYVADTNNHKIRVIDLQNNQVSTLEIEGLDPPRLEDTSPPSPRLPGAAEVELQPQQVRLSDGQITLNVQLNLPAGWKINSLAPMRYLVEMLPPQGPIERSAAANKKVEPPEAKFQVQLPVTSAGEDTLRLALTYYYCQEDNEGLCKIGSVVWTVPVVIDPQAATSSVTLTHQVKE